MHRGLEVKRWNKNLGHANLFIIVTCRYAKVECGKKIKLNQFYSVLQLITNSKNDESDENDEKKHIKNYFIVFGFHNIEEICIAAMIYEDPCMWRRFFKDIFFF